MINKSKLTDALFGIVGSRQPANPDYAILSADNTESRSGYYVTDNSFCKVELLKDTQDFHGISDVAFNEMLSNLQRSSIAAVVNSVTTKEVYRDRQVLYKYPQNKRNTRQFQDGFVGINIVPDSEKNLAFEISRLILNFDNTPNDLTLYLFSSEQFAPINQKTITVTSDNHVELLRWVVDNTDDIYKGEYKLGYFAQDTALVPYQRDYENSNLKSAISNLWVQEIRADGATPGQLWDLDDEDNIEADTGLNPDITVYDDHTNLVIQNERLFAYAISLDMQIRWMSNYITSIRSNKEERHGKEIAAKALQMIEGQDGRDGRIKIKGLRSTFTQEIDRLRTELEKLNKGYEGGTIMVDTLC